MIVYIEQEDMKMTKEKEMRKSNGYTKTVQFRLTPEDKAMFDKISEWTGENHSQALRGILRRYYRECQQAEIEYIKALEAKYN